MKPIALVALLIVAGACEVRRLNADAGDESVARGRELVEKTCVGCHPGAQLDALVGSRLDAKDPAPFRAFLARHHVSDEALRSDVIAYLLTRLNAASSGE